MAAETFKCAILPQSGRAVRFVKLLFEDYEAARESAASRFPKDAVKRGAAQQRELVARALRGISREVVPLIALKQPEPQTAAAVDDEAPLDSLLQLPDVKAMVASVDEGAGGGWQEITYAQMIKPGSGVTIKELFNQFPLDFDHCVSLVEATSYAPKSPGLMLTAWTTV